MSKLSTARFTLAALTAAFLIPFAGGAFAQSIDGRSTAEVEKENAALRAKVHRLEAEKENIGLHAKLDQLQGRRPAQVAGTDAAQATPYPLVTRIEASSPDRSLVMADMPMKAAPASIPYYSWSGFYLGGNIGYGVGNDRVQPTFDLDGAAVQPSDSAAVPAGVVGGVQLGYNWQGGSNWLVGLETDFQGSAQKVTTCVMTCDTSTLQGVSGTSQQVPAITQTLDYFGTVRGRFGFVDRGNLFYVTGGGAYGHVNQALDFRFAVFSPTSFAASASSSENKLGWVVGAGLESSIGGNWTVKAEYLYMDLGSTATTLSGAVPLSGLNPPSPLTFTSVTSIRDNIVRAGLNYRFGPPAGPVSAYDAMAAVPPAVSSWTGFYAGVNAGYGFGNNRVETTETSTVFVFPTSTSNDAPGTSVAPKGVLGGAQAGYNWQASQHWLAGFEADLQGAAQNDTTCSALNCEIFLDGSGHFVIRVQHQLDWFGTLRGRIGAVYNNTLFYATGGPAFAHLRETIHTDLSGGGVAGVFLDQTTAKDLFGYAVGGGIEAMLWGGWSAKAEYLYLNLGDISSSADLSIPGLIRPLVTRSDIRDHIVRIGANYHFGAAPY
jgi:outer membrane immunogenic protein